ncbi:MAG: sigma 54-dependent Fis family transcriptional regulator [Myxococcales bacterium]|nr:sigma 54-dependent Fis family transcriptional regulator [Myxococcales bacterium]
MTRADGPPTETVTVADTVGVPPELVLVVVAGPDEGKRFAVPWGTFTLGKSGSCDFVVDDPAVSRRHLEIARRASSLEVRDLGSHNGSFFRGARFERIAVGVGARLRIGRSELWLRLPEAGLPESEGFGELVGGSPAMQSVFAYLRRAAPSTLPVLIQGETGTGKELVARAIHAASGRSGPLVTCDLAGISPSLIESELFGHRRGAFTGAEEDREGAFLRADGGTLFLDEVGELAMDQQPRLLRALEAGEVKRVGDNVYREVDVRVVAATNRDLADEVAAGTFRSDLYHRLAVLCVAMPPLRERHGDIPLLVRHFAEAVAPGNSLRFPPASLEALERHDWLGNLRELRNVVERALAFCTEDGSVTREVLGLDEETPGAVPRARPASLELPFKDAKSRLVEVWERDYVTALMEACEGNVSLAARRAGMHRVHLHRLIKKHLSDDE